MLVSRSHLHSWAARSACPALVTDQSGYPASEFRDAFLFVEQGTQLFLEHHTAQAISAFTEWLFAILVPEKRCVCEAWSNNTFISCLDLCGVGTDQIRDSNEVG